VRILKDLPTFKALDNRNYALSAEDVVVLPTLNAQGLVKRNVAHIIKKL
jgi:DNA replication factor GINS